MLCRATGALASENDIAGFELPIPCGGFATPRITSELVIKDPQRRQVFSLGFAELCLHAALPSAVDPALRRLNATLL